MEPGNNPPRRSKPEQDPVTIDLEASRIATEETEAVASAEPITDESSDITAADSLKTGEDIQDEPTENVKAGHEPVSPATNASKPSSSRSSAFAAGIVGGLIALAGAGGLQYAGVLPALGPSSTSDSTAQQNLAAEIAALKTRLGEVASSTTGLSAVETRLAELERVQGSGTAPAAEITRLETTIQTLVSDLAATKAELEKAAAVQADSERSLASRIDAAEEKLAEPRNDVEVAKAIAATALKTAIDRGGPYLAELEALASVAPDDPSVAALRETASIGVPSRADLVQAFPDVATAILDAVHQPDPNAGIFDRLMASASSVVRVRPVGTIEGASPEAIVARIENRLQNGDLKGARIEWEGLDDAGKAASSPFKASLDQRIKTEDLIGAIVSGATAITGRQG